MGKEVKIVAKLKNNKWTSLDFLPPQAWKLFCLSCFEHVRKGCFIQDQKNLY